MSQDRQAIRSNSAPIVAPEAAVRRNLEYIRDTLEKSSSFTAVPGWGNVWIGIVGLAASLTSWLQPTEARWLSVWLVAAVVSVAIGVATVYLKAVRLGLPLLGGAGRKFVFGLAPAFFSGALLTAVLYDAALFELLPAVWLLLYGAAIVTAGINSIPLIRYLGFAFMFVGTVAFFVPSGWGDWFLAIGFGGFHLAAGAFIIRRYGG